MIKKKALNDLKTLLEKNPNLPLKDTATNLVFGEGNPDAQLMFIGEAPGAQEDATGRPFVGRAGRLLEKLLNEIGLNREDVYISNTVKYRPPQNRPPKPAEIEAFAPFVKQEIEIIKPKLIVPLGRFAMEKFLPDAKISQVHGTLHEVNWHGIKIKLFPLYHPSAALRGTKVLNILKEDFQKLRDLV